MAVFGPPPHWNWPNIKRQLSPCQYANIRKLILWLTEKYPVLAHVGNSWVGIRTGTDLFHLIIAGENCRKSWLFWGGTHPGIALNSKYSCPHVSVLTLENYFCGLRRNILFFHTWYIWVGIWTGTDLIHLIIAGENCWNSWLFLAPHPPRIVLMSNVSCPHVNLLTLKTYFCGLQRNMLFLHTQSMHGWHNELSNCYL